MKVEVQFHGNSVDIDTYEAEYVEWVFHEGQVHIYAGESPDNPPRVGSYPEGRIVRIRIVDELPQVP